MLDPEANITFAKRNDQYIDPVEATQHLRGELGDTETPVVALTASAMKGDRERFLAAGMSHYLSKPIRKIALMEILSVWAPIEGNTPSQ